MDDTKVSRMRDRARQMRRAAGMSHDPRIIEILLTAANEAETDADELEAELRNQPRNDIPLPPQT